MPKATRQFGKHNDAAATDFDMIKMEYDQLNANFRALADIRFKLLALLPPLGGVAVFVLGQMAGKPDITGSQSVLVLLVSSLGFLATLGITFYDQRNSELYNAFVGRANYLEHAAKLKENPDFYPPRPGGQFLERPKPGRKLFKRPALLMKHDRGLALIYGPVLGAWFFPIGYSVLGGLSALGLKFLDSLRPSLAISVATIMVIVFILELLRLDDTFSESRSGIVEFYSSRTRKLRLKYTIRNVEKKLTGVLARNLVVKKKDYQAHCKSEEADKVEVPKGARVSVRYKNSFLTKPKPKIFKIECLEKAKPPIPAEPEK